MIKWIELSNFKCFKKLELNCSPLTLLCGMNGMGKSSVIQALLVLRQSYEVRPLREGRLVLDGRLTDIGTGKNVLCEDANADVIEFLLYRDDTQEPCRLAYDYDRTSDRLDMRRSEAAPERFGGFGVPETWWELPPFGGSLFYVNAERVGPRKTYALSEAFRHSGDLGAHGEYAPNYLSSYGHRTHPDDDPRFEGCESRRLTAGIERWLGEVSPGAHLWLERIPDADAVVAGFSFGREGDIETQRYGATNVGFGLSYILPVLVAMFGPSGSLCLIENPEAHLHPRGQTRLAELAVRATMAGVQVIVETHSDHFMDGVRIAVRDGLIPPGNAAFHYFERRDARMVVSSPKIDANGRISAWPAGFFDQHEENLARLLAPPS